MKYAILYNTFLCWMVSGMSAFLAWQVMTSPKTHDGQRAFGIFWGFSSALWLCSGLRQLLLFFGFLNLDKTVFYLVQFILGFNVMAGVIFLTWNATSNGPARKIITALFGATCILFICTFFSQGIAQTDTTVWGSDHKMTDGAYRLFLPPYVYCVAMTVYVIVQKTVRVVLKLPVDRKLFAAVIALLLYETAGIVDIKGLFADYRLVIVRGIYMISALIAYMTYTWQTTTMEVVVKESETGK